MFHGGGSPGFGLPPGAFSSSTPATPTVSSKKVTIKANPRPMATSAQPVVLGIPDAAPAAAGSISKFASKIYGRGVQRQNKYAVFLGDVPGAGKSDDVTLMAESVSFPGQNIRSVPDLLRFGPAREHAQGFTYSPFNITFICTPGMPEKKFFENWQEAIVNKETWEPRFYKYYVAGEMRMIALSEEEDDRYIVHIHEAYPKTISPQSFSYAANDSYQTIDVEFTYRSWESELLSEPVGKFPISMVDAFSAFTGGSGSVESRAVDDFSSRFKTPNVDDFAQAHATAAATHANEFGGISPTPAQPVPQSVNPHSTPAPAAKANKLTIGQGGTATSSAPR